ncbi:MAG: hypothetical protein V3U98_08190 [Acidobacteriota bacterium]
MKKGIICLALLTVACGLFGSNPRKSVSKFLDALGEGEYETAYEYLSSRDRAVKSVEVFRSEGAAGVLPGGLPAQLDYEVREVIVDGKQAKVHVALTAAGSAATQRGADLHLFELVEEDEGWKLFLGWEAQALLAEAHELRGAGEWHEALERLEKALELDPENSEAATARDEVLEQLHWIERTQSYMRNHVEVLGFKVTPDPRRAGPGTSVTGKILNNGHLTLSEVELTVYFLAEDGSVVAQKAYRPIPSIEVNYYGESPSLRRGSVKEFGYMVDGPLPPEWSGRARAMVTMIQIEDNA